MDSEAKAGAILLTLIVFLLLGLLLVGRGCQQDKQAAILACIKAGQAADICGRVVNDVR